MNLTKSYLSGNSKVRTSAPRQEVSCVFQELLAAQTGVELGAAFTRNRSSIDPLQALAVVRMALSFDNELLAIQAFLQATRASFEVIDQDRLNEAGFTSMSELGDLMLTMKARHERRLRLCLEDLVAVHGPKALFRMERTIAGYLGEIPVVPGALTQKAKWIFVPGLTCDGYLSVKDHPICDELARNFSAIREEYLSVLSSPNDRLEAFLGGAKGVLDGYVSGTDPRASWDAFFFFRHGQRYDENHALCPHTSSVLEQMDLCRIDGQAPEVCFSVMQPGTVIERHHGVTNARVVVHLPLVVPKTGECYLDVSGCGRHYWKEGEPMMFDDTFEHGATNASGEPRGILLMDAWHPALSLVEREAFQRIIQYLSLVGAQNARH